VTLITFFSLSLVDVIVSAAAIISLSAAVCGFQVAAVSRTRYRKEISIFISTANFWFPLSCIKYSGSMLMPNKFGRLYAFIA
jgi:hypothetical protein